MTYELKHKNNTINPTLESGRYRYKITPETPYDELKLVHGGQIGDWYFDQLMLNQGDFEQYEENTNTESMLGMAFRHIQELQTVWSDENGDMTRMVREGMRSTYRIYQDIQEGTSSETLDSDNGIYRLIKDTHTNSMSEFIQTSDVFSSRIGDIIENDLSIGTQISQTKDMIELAFFGSNDDQISRLAVGEPGIYLNGALVDLDGNAKFNDVFARNVWAEGITASNVTAMSAQFGHAIINNLDVNSATVNKASFIEALFNGVKTRVRIHGDGMDVLRNDGSFSTRFISNGLQIWRDGLHMGSVISLTPIGSGDTGWFQGKRSMSIAGEFGTFISISMRNTNGNLGRLMAFNDQQKIRLYAPLYADNAFTRGIQIKSSTIGNKAAVILGSSDFYTESAVAFRNDGAFLVRRPDNGQFINLPDEILNIRNRLNALEGSSGGGGGDGGTTTTYHTTKAGEYPSLIAEMYGITLQQLYNWNTWYTPGSVVKVGDRWRVS